MFAMELKHKLLGLYLEANVHTISKISLYKNNTNGKCMIVEHIPPKSAAIKHKQQNKGTHKTLKILIFLKNDALIQLFNFL